MNKYQIDLDIMILIFSLLTKLDLFWYFSNCTLEPSFHRSKVKLSTELLKMHLYYKPKSIS